MTASTGQADAVLSTQAWLEQQAQGADLDAPTNYAQQISAQIAMRTRLLQFASGQHPSSFSVLSARLACCRKRTSCAGSVMSTTRNWRRLSFSRA